MKKRNIKIMIGILLIFIGVLIGIYNYYKMINTNNLEEKSVEVFFEDISNSKEKKSSKLKDENIINYIAVLEIPKIDIKRGLVNPNSSQNNVSQNIEILEPVEMPNKKNGTFILASHSGSSRVAFFDRLNELQKGDSVFIYYKNIKYHYIIDTYYEENKTGKITINKTKNKNAIVLTSCKKGTTKKQLIYIGYLNEKEKL